MNHLCRIRHGWLSGLVLALSVLLAGCNHGLPPETVGDELDLQRYQGVWYEQARLPTYFQEGCVQSEAHYTLESPRLMQVENLCLGADGRWLSAKGAIWPQRDERIDQLWVLFDDDFGRWAPFFARTAYWVFYVSPDYDLALVGTPDREYLWLLSRDKQLGDAGRHTLLAEARVRGFADLDSRLIWRKPDL